MNQHKPSTYMHKPYMRGDQALRVLMANFAWRLYSDAVDAQHAKPHGKRTFKRVRAARHAHIACDVPYVLTVDAGKLREANAYTETTCELAAETMLEWDLPGIG